jgi:hypothetical protein
MQIKRLICSGERAPQIPDTGMFNLCLAGALGLMGDVDEAKVVLAEAIRLKPEVRSRAG